MSSRALSLALCVALFLGSYAVTGAQTAGGRAGYAIAPEPADSAGRAIAVQADGAIVLAGPQGRGAEHRYRVAVVRLTPEGQLDTSFNRRGFVTTEIGQVSDFVRGLAIQRDGKIVVAAATKMADHSEVFSLVRFAADGELDARFGDGGKVTTQLSSVKIRLTKMGALALQPDGKILVTAHRLLLRYLPNGRPDPDFGEAGIRDDVLRQPHRRAARRHDSAR